MTSLAQGVKGSPTVTTGGSASWLGDLRGLLGDGFGMYLQYEQLQNQQNPTLAVIDKQLTTELANGSATVVENTANGTTTNGNGQNINVFGMSVPKPIAYIGGALLALVAVKKLGVL